MDTLTGQTIKGYGIQDCIGKGAFGEVYRAYQAVVDREVAIKVILPQYANQPDFVRRFETEAQLVAHLEHIHIVPLYDYWRDPTGAYLVMRYLRGGNLRDWVKGGPLSPEEALRVMEQIARALDLAHQHTIIHRDIKPNNILLDEERNAFLTDFGLAKVMGRESSQEGLLGTPEYISPEQIQGQEIGPQADLYAMGLVLYEMLAGNPAFRPSNMAEMVDLHLKTPVPDITQQRDDVPATINDVIQIATAKTSSERYPDALALARALREALAVAPDVQIEAAAPLIEPLTDREHDVLRLMAQGLSNREIGEQLVIALSTVKWYVRQIYGKLGVTKRRQALVAAQHLKLLDAEPGTAVPVDLALPEWMVGENPYKGLEAFQQADTANFFGRETLIEHLVTCLHADGDLNRFLAVVGPSGGGKSSVVRAGLLSALAKGAVPGAEHWFVVDMLPGVRPLDELEIRLLQKAVRPAPDLAEQLMRDAHGLTRAARLILPEDGELLLVVDQLEELFTLVEDPAIARHFLSLIHAAVTDSRSNVHVIITLRADFLDRPLIFSDFGELLRWRTELITPMTPEELEAAIVRPAENAGVVVEPGLVAALVAEVSEQPGTLPLLEYALTELFDRREGRTMTLAAYHDLDGALGALTRRANDLFDDLADIERQATRQVFLRLVTLGEGTEDVRRRVLRSELESVDVDRAVMEDVIDTFGEDRLLTFDFDPVTREPTVEVAHEALIQRWGRLRDWLDASRDDVRLQRMLGTAAQDWREANRDTDFLLRGSRLAQFKEWADQTDIVLTDEECIFLEHSITNEEFRRTRRRRVRNAIVSAAVLVAVVMTVLALIALDREQRAQDAREDAQAERDNAQHLALASRAQLFLANYDLVSAVTLALEANRGESPSPEAQRVLADVAYRPGIMAEFETASIVFGIEFSPDGKTILTSGWQAAMWYDLATGEPIFVFDEPTEAYYATFSPNGTQTLIVGPGPPVLWDLTNRTVIHRLEGHADVVGFADFSPDGTRALTSGGWETVSPYNLILWDLTTGDMIRNFDGHTKGGVAGVDFSPDGTRFLSGGAFDFQIFEWDVETGEIIRSIGAEGEGHTDAVVFVQYSPDGTRALSVSNDQTVRLWDLTTNTLIYSFDIQRIGLPAVSPDGRTALTVAEADDRSVVWWDLETGQPILTLPHVLDVSGMAFSPDGHTALTASNLGGWTVHKLQLWDLTIDQRLRQIPLGSLPTNPELQAHFLRISPDEQTALISTMLRSGGEGPCPLMLVDMQTGQEIHRFEAPTELEDSCPQDVFFSTHGMAFSPDGRIAVEAKHYGPVIFWDVDPASPTFGKALHVRLDHGDWASGASFSSDGRMALTGGREHAIIWDVESGEMIRRIDGLSGAVMPGTFSSDNRTVLVSATGGRMSLYDLANGEEIWRAEGLTGWPMQPAFTPDGDMVLVSDAEGDLKLFDAETGELIQHMRDKGRQNGYRYFSPDGRYIFSGLPEGITQWDFARGETIRHYPTGGGGIDIEFALSADGKSFYVLDYEEGVINQWRIDTHEELVAWVEANRYVRELTCKERTDYGIEPLCE